MVTTSTRRLRLRDEADAVAGRLPYRSVLVVGGRDDRNIARRHAERQMQDRRLRARHGQSAPCAERPRGGGGEVGKPLFRRQPPQRLR